MPGEFAHYALTIYLIRTSLSGITGLVLCSPGLGDQVLVTLGFSRSSTIVYLLLHHICASSLLKRNLLCKFLLLRGEPYFQTFDNFVDRFVVKVIQISEIPQFKRILRRAALADEANKIGPGPIFRRQKTLQFGPQDPDISGGWSCGLREFAKC